MKVRRQVVESVVVAFIEVEAAVRYDEEDMPNDFPGRKGDLWTVRIVPDNGDLYLGAGIPFPADVSIDLHMKVCDAGKYRLLTLDGETIVERDDYVPGCFPGSHYGDYLILNIAGGKVTNWKCDSRDIEESFALLENIEC